MKLRQLLENEGFKAKDGRIVSTHDDEFHRNFDCSGYNLTTLEGCPSSVDGYFSCLDNYLTSLEGCPSIVSGGFSCSDNQLTSLEHCPTTISGYFGCKENKLTSLEYCPKTVGEFFNCSDNQLTSLEHCPSSVGGFFNCSDNQLTSLEGIHKHLKKMSGGFHADGNPIESHILGVFLIPGCTRLQIDNRKVQDIVNKYLWVGRDGLIDCQNELIEAGFEDYAQI